MATICIHIFFVPVRISEILKLEIKILGLPKQ